MGEYHSEELLRYVVERQKRSMERVATKTIADVVRAGDRKIICQPKVSIPHIDSRLLARTAIVLPHETVLEPFSGTGVVTVLVAPHARWVTATDINPFAVENIQANITYHGLLNAEVTLSDIFPAISSVYDVMILNPPYTDHPVENVIQRAVWDPGHASVLRFFSEATKFLKTEGRIYLSWASFADFAFVEHLAESAGFDWAVRAFEEEHLSDFMGEAPTNGEAAARIVYRIYEMTRQRAI